MAWTQLFIQLALGLLGLSLIRSLLLPRFPKLRDNHLDFILIVILIISGAIYLVDDRSKEDKSNQLERSVKAAESQAKIIEDRMDCAPLTGEKI